MEGLSAGLVGHPCLEALILDGNDVGLDGTQSLCDSLLQNTSVKTLVLRRNSLLADSTEVRNSFASTADFLLCFWGGGGRKGLYPVVFLRLFVFCVRHLSRLDVLDVNSWVGRLFFVWPDHDSFTSQLCRVLT